LQKKRHSDEFLRTIAHLRPRTNRFGAMFRIRSETSFAIHEYFRERAFFHVHTPILTGSDAEGAGEMFRVTTLPPVPSAPPPADPFAGDFFGRECGLTVSGQLEAEALALALGKVYTFGPTFRAENSHTPRHCAEFWMIEPEAAFADLEDIMDLGEDFVRQIVARVLARCSGDLELFNRFVDASLLERLHLLAETPFARVSYAEAMDILGGSGRAFSYPAVAGADIQTEHERFLAEEYFRRPVVVHDYPRDIKAFYMRANEDKSTVAAMDILVPRVGELIGGSQREERADVLEKRLRELGRDPEDYWWYLDLRRFGSVPHAGFGLGFERLLMLLTGTANIRDVIPFPRTQRNLEF
jgi:asparaginyl-tRNA synthetase